MASVKKEDFKVAEERSPRKVETGTSQDLLNQPTVHLSALSSQDNTRLLRESHRDATQTAEARDHTDNTFPDHTATNDNGANCRMH